LTYVLIAGLTYEDVAVMLVKAMGSDAAWTRSGLAPGWALQGAMQFHYSTAVASVAVAGTLLQGG
jgi:hypothetical protein